MEYKYYFSKLDKKSADLYRFILGKLNEGAREIWVNSDTDTANKIINAILFDEPRLFWFEGKWQCENSNGFLRIIPQYKKSLAQKNAISDKICEKLTQRMPRNCLDDAERIRKVYDGILDSVLYRPTENDQNIMGAIFEGAAVCKGIAKTFQLYMNSLEIPSLIVKGTIDGKAPHIWNIVYLRGKPYHIDVTMGYPEFSVLFKGMNRNKKYPCFLVSDATISNTHRILSPAPLCSDDFDLYPWLFDSMRIPERFKALGDISFLDRGSTCNVLKIKGESELVLKVIETENNHLKLQNALHELELLQKLRDCRNTVGMIDFQYDEQNGTVFLLQPLLKTLSQRRHEPDFDIMKHTALLGRDILTALIECRNYGVFHLDIQPKNIFFDNSGRAFLGDFGSSVREDELLLLKEKRGTVSFAAPEVLKSACFSEASEIYSLGIVMYCLLNHACLPFSENQGMREALALRIGGKPLPIPSTGDTPLYRSIAPMCEFDPAKRPQKYEDALELIKKL